MTAINCYTEIVTVAAPELANAIAPYSHLIPLDYVRFNSAEDGNLVVELFNGIIDWDSVKLGKIAVQAQYLSPVIPGGEPTLPSFAPTTVTTTEEKAKRTRRSKAQIAADEAAKAEQLAAIAKAEAEAVLDADAEADIEVEAVEDIIYEVEADHDETTEEPEVTSEISTVSKRNLFANAA